MDIFRLDQALIDRYETFARSFSEIRAPEIRGQVDAAYADHRYWPEPLITINPRFEEGASVDQLVAQGVLDPSLTTIFASGPDRTPISLHRHQERAVAKARNGESFIVTTGTGSGKSLCFLLPIVDAIVRARRADDAYATIVDLPGSLPGKAGSAGLRDQPLHGPVDRSMVAVVTRRCRYLT